MSSRPPAAVRGVCVFDLDGTLTVDRTLDRLQRLRDVPLSDRTAGMKESLDVMRSFEGQPWSRFASACASSRLHPDAPAVIDRLHALGIRCGIATASYLPAAEAVARRLGIEVVAALSPQVQDGRLTGAFAPTPWTGACGRPVCKAEALRAFAEAASPAAPPDSLPAVAPDGSAATPAEVPSTPTGPTGVCPHTPIASRMPMVAVGDGSNDVCMLRSADLGVAVVPAHPLAAAAADHTAPLADVPRLVDVLLAGGDHAVESVARVSPSRGRR